MNQCGKYGRGLPEQLAQKASKLICVPAMAKRYLINYTFYNYTARIF